MFCSFNMVCLGMELFLYILFEDWSASSSWRFMFFIIFENFWLLYILILSFLQLFVLFYYKFVDFFIFFSFSHNYLLYFPLLYLFVQYFGWPPHSYFLSQQFSFQLHLKYDFTHPVNFNFYDYFFIYTSFAWFFKQLPGISLWFLVSSHFLFYYFKHTYFIVFQNVHLWEALGMLFILFFCVWKLAHGKLSFVLSAIFIGDFFIGENPVLPEL